MRDASDQQIIELRKRAEHYRQLADGPMPWAVARQLDALAEECDREAMTRLGEPLLHEALPR
ncbi:MAG TPA: hypothetical protein VMA53_18220 [Stellaceae bacterium]|nr:hypothetical protein [Stellaceae bacterium]